MRLPFPVHIPLQYVVTFAAVLFGLQLMQGTKASFAICSFLFIVVSGLTFNVAGGFSRPSGAYVFFYATLAAIVGLCWKAVLGEPADSNLVAPLLTMQVFLGSMVAMLGAVFLSRKLTVRRPLLAELVNDSNLQNATVGCMVTGLVVGLILAVLPHEGGSFLSALAQINRFLPMALILGVIHQMRRTGGRSAVSIPVLVSGGAIMFTGLSGFSKEGIFTPLACWFVAAGSQGYRLSRTQIAGFVLVIFLMFRYLVPYSQYGRNFTADTFWERVEVSVRLLGSLEEVRETYKASNEEAYLIRKQGYFNTPQGFADRLQMVSVDDGLIDQTERTGTFGVSPLIVGFQNLVPHFVWRDKPVIGFGNLYAHELGGLPDDDYTTGISFSPSGEAYHMSGWLGVFILAPLMWILLFVIFDSLCGDTRTSPWGLLMVAYFSHMAPEGMLSGITYTIGYVSFAVIVAALSAAYVMPIFGTLMKGPEAISLRRIAAVRSVPRRVRAVSVADTGE